MLGSSFEQALATPVVESDSLTSHELAAQAAECGEHTDAPSCSHDIEENIISPSSVPPSFLASLNETAHAPDVASMLASLPYSSNGTQLYSTLISYLFDTSIEVE